MLSAHSAFSGLPVNLYIQRDGYICSPRWIYVHHTEYIDSPRGQKQGKMWAYGCFLVGWNKNMWTEQKQSLYLDETEASLQ